MPFKCGLGAVSIQMNGTYLVSHGLKRSLWKVWHEGGGFGSGWDSIIFSNHTGLGLPWKMYRVLLWSQKVKYIYTLGNPSWNKTWYFYRTACVFPTVHHSFCNLGVNLGFFFIVFLCILRGYMHATVYCWSQRTIWELVPSFYHEGHGDWVHVSRVNGGVLYHGAALLA